MDVPAIESCIKAAYSIYVDRIGKPPAPMLDDFEELVDAGYVRVASSTDGQLLGVVVYWPVDDHLYIDNVATTSVARGRGVGSALLSDAEDAARNLGLSELRLYTNVAMTENLSYYPKIGFTETHRGVQDGYERVFFSRPVGDAPVQKQVKHS